MKKALSLLLALVMCLSLCACNTDQESKEAKEAKEAYDTYLSGKSFESEGSVLSFDDDNQMTYYYENLVGDTFRYTYSVGDIENDGNTITFTVKQIAANTEKENSHKNEEITVSYDIANNSVKYYNRTYVYID